MPANDIVAARQNRRSAVDARARGVTDNEQPMTDAELFIVEVEDHCEPRLVGHAGCSYSSPPQPPATALALVRALLGCPATPPVMSGSPWRCAIAGGHRTIRLHPASPAGQLRL
jgi:hypothetical protein